MFKRTVLVLSAVALLTSSALTMVVTPANAANCANCVVSTDTPAPPPPTGGGGPVDGGGAGDPGGGAPGDGGGLPGDGGGLPGDGGVPPGDGSSSKPFDEGDAFLAIEAARKAKLLIACRPEDGEAVTALRFRNIGKAPIPQGSRVLWQVLASGDQGEFFLPHELAAGKELSQADMLKLGVPADAHCLSKAI